MAKIILLYNELIFLNVLPELHPDFIEKKIRESRQMFPQTNSQNDENTNKQ